MSVTRHILPTYFDVAETISVVKMSIHSWSSNRSNHWEYGKLNLRYEALCPVLIEYKPTPNNHQTRLPNSLNEHPGQGTKWHATC